MQSWVERQCVGTPRLEAAAAWANPTRPPSEGSGEQPCAFPASPPHRLHILFPATTKSIRAGASAVRTVCQRGSVPLPAALPGPSVLPWQPTLRLPQTPGPATEPTCRRPRAALSGRRGAGAGRRRAWSQSGLLACARPAAGGAAAALLPGSVLPDSVRPPLHPWVRAQRQPSPSQDEHGSWHTRHRTCHLPTHPLYRPKRAGCRGQGPEAAYIGRRLRGAHSVREVLRSLA